MLHWMSYKSEMKGQVAKVSPTDAEPMLSQTILRVSVWDCFQVICYDL